MKIAVTGAFGYSGRYIARRLLDAGHEVITLTHRLRGPNLFGSRVRVFPFDFDRPGELKESLSGVDVLVNNYWVRFNHRRFTHEQAVRNTKILFEAARQAGVRRIIHISITNPDSRSGLSYFRGKAELELALQRLGPSYCILRPAVLFGNEDVLINNIAWSLRKLPLFGIFGRGDYQLQPIYVDDLAIVVTGKASEQKNEIIEAIGPETFSYRTLVHMIRDTLGLQTPIVSMPPTVAYWACRILGLVLHDVIITREEIRGLRENRLFVDAPALGPTRLSAWAARHAETLGRHYASELARRFA